MSHFYWFCLLVAVALVVSACGGQAQPIPLTQTSIPSSNTPSYTPTEVPTNTPAPTDTETATSTLAPTATPPPLTATYQAFLVAQTQMVGTEFAQFGPAAHMSGFTIFYANPVGTPLKSWHAVPIMAEATAGQEFQSDIYSYKAGATLQKATGFYSSAANASDWSCIQATGSGGTGDLAEHDSDFMCGSFSIIVASFDNDPNQALVVINKVP